MFEGDFIVPEYYSRFQCKGKACRNCCCHGFYVTLSQKEYFSLHSLDVSDGLREKMDAYVGLIENGNPEEYGRIYPNYFGDCPLRLENGYCGLQTEVGEDKIPSVCRYFPRAPRLYPFPMVSLSLACEWLTEDFFSHPGKFSFVHQRLKFFFDDDETKREDEKDGAKMKELISLFLSKESLVDVLYALERRYHLEKEFSLEKDRERLSFLRDIYDERSSMYSFLNGDGKPDSVEKMLSVIEDRVPGSYEVIRKIFINHILYMNIPFVASLGKEESVYGLISVFHLFVSFLYWSGVSSKEDFVLMTSLCFRSFEHSNVYQELALFYEKKWKNFD